MLHWAELPLDIELANVSSTEHGQYVDHSASDVDPSKQVGRLRFVLALTLDLTGLAGHCLDDGGGCCIESVFFCGLWEM